MSTVQPLTSLQYLALIHEVSYSSLCKDIGVTPQQFTDWVKKRRPIPKERLESLVQYFDIDKDALVGDNSYLHDLTEQKKNEIQIAYLRKRLNEHCTIDEKEAYETKLEKLSREKEALIQLDRFKIAYEQGSDYTRHLCRQFLSKIEQGLESQLEPILLQGE